MTSTEIKYILKCMFKRNTYFICFWSLYNRLKSFFLVPLSHFMTLSDASSPTKNLDCSFAVFSASNLLNLPNEHYILQNPHSFLWIPEILILFLIVSINFYLAPVFLWEPHHSLFKTISYLREDCPAFTDDAWLSTARWWRSAY